MSIKAVIFDMGGVLLRTEDRAPRIALAKRFGLTWQELEQIVFGGESSVMAETGEVDQADHWRQVMHTLKLPLEELPAFEKAFWAGDRMDVELVERIRDLRRSYKTALLSNAWNGTKVAVLGIYDFSYAFDLMIFSAEVGMRKPDAAIFRLVTEKLGVQPAEAIFVDDFEHNVVGARAAGLAAIHFRNREQALAELEQMLNGSQAALTA